MRQSNMPHPRPEVAGYLQTRASPSTGYVLSASDLIRARQGNWRESTATP
jgi:hypothetical protein